MKGVRPKLDPGADFAEGCGFFEQDRANAFLGEAERRGKAADAAARDQDCLRCPVRHQLAFPGAVDLTFASVAPRDVMANVKS
jgi:hypothetical protein